MFIKFITVAFVMKGSLLTDSFNKRISFTPKGFNLFEMGSKISKEVESDLMNIDTSTTAGLIDWASIQKSYYTRLGYLYKKLDTKAYSLDGLPDKTAFDFLLALSHEGEIRAIRIKLKKHVMSGEVLSKTYGKHDTKVSTEYAIDSKDVAYESLYWTLPNFDIRLSGMDIEFYFRKPLKNVEMLIKKNDDQ